MPCYMLSVKPDLPCDEDGKPVPSSARYRPLPYDRGEVCEPCWLTIDAFNGYGANWVLHDIRGLRTVGSDGCPHGGESR